jgi:UDP-N-acetylmuramate dehydrogenase
MMAAEIKELIKREVPAGSVRYDEPMGGNTSLRIGGPADVLIEPESPEAVSRVLGLLKRSGVPCLPVGGGTNLLVSDRGIEGAALSLASLRGIETMEEDDGWAALRVGAGTPLQGLLAYCAKHGLSGIEGLSGIPGQAGGAIAGNAGSFGCEIKDVLTKITLAESGGGRRVLGSEDVAFGYRHAGLPEGSVILAVELRCAKDSPDAVAERMKGHLETKRKTQPLGRRSAGCVFKNPPGESAGRLMDRAGCKGMRVGGIEVSQVHAGFFINAGKGTAEDFLRLMDAVAGKVKEAFGITLEPEIRIVGRC